MFTDEGKGWTTAQYMYLFCLQVVEHYVSMQPMVKTVSCHLLEIGNRFSAI